MSFRAYGPDAPARGPEAPALQPDVTKGLSCGRSELAFATIVHDEQLGSSITAPRQTAGLLDHLGKATT